MNRSAAQQRIARSIMIRRSIALRAPASRTGKTRRAPQTSKAPKQASPIPQNVAAPLKAETTILFFEQGPTGHLDQGLALEFADTGAIGKAFGLDHVAGMGFDIDLHAVSDTVYACVDPYDLRTHERRSLMFAGSYSELLREFDESFSCD
jgi:hypothetical protein